MSDVKITAARQEQSKASKASVLDRLKSKKARTRELTISLDGEVVTLKFRAISLDALEKLRAKYPPTTAQRAQGAGVNIKQFAPALVAATMVDPEMTEEDAREIWESGTWSSGELDQLFETASQVCMEGMDIPSNASV